VAVSLTAIEGGLVQFEIRDDGAGIELAEVRSAAARYRIMSAEAAQALSDDVALELIFQSGLSTSTLITDLAGHGLGLPIVRERVERLGGRIDVESTPGVGTSMRVIVPSSIATFRGLQVQSGDQTFLLPLESVERAVRVATDDVRRVEGRHVLVTDAGPIPFAQLDALLDLPDQVPASVGNELCIILRAGDDRVALGIDAVLGDSEVLVKELQPPLFRVRHVAAAGLLGSGRLALILRPGDLVRAARSGIHMKRMSSSGASERPGPARILVVDDSITTRTMGKSLLEAQGFHVQVAVDGLDAWTLLKSESFDLVLSDVDMPRMNGLDLTARIRADEKLADLPVVLVTALESREDKERGIEVGANAYVVKSGFDQANVLGTIRRLI
jgi:two-component system chemotaxis sensor kinase CheA